MNPPTDQPPNPESSMHNPLSVMQPGEQLIAEIKRHPIGIIGMYVALGLATVVVIIAIFVALPHLLLTNYDHNQAVTISTVVAAIVLIMSLGIAVVLNKIYWGNRWIVTTDSITQIIQTRLFTRRSSQLSMASIEDVTAEQNGLLTEALNYGVLKAETAGENSKFIFLYCPKPTYYAQQILNARERFEQCHEGRPSTETPTPAAEASTSKQ